MKARLGTRLGAALAGALILLGLVVPAGEAAGLSLTWPLMTSFNPDQTPYTFTIEDDGDGTLFADWRGDRVEIPHSGQVTMVFPTDGDGQILILRCSDPTQCSQVSTSAVLHVVTKLTIRGAGQTLWASPHVPTKAPTITSIPAGSPFDFSWELRTTADADDPANPVLASGVSQGSPPGSAQFEFQAPPGLVQKGLYTLLVDAVAHTDAYGDLAGSYTQPVAYDALATATISASRELFYPAGDRYLDDVRFKVRTDLKNYAVRVLDAQGAVVRRDLDQDGGRLSDYVWNGRYASGKQVPEGRYTVRVAGSDWAGNTAGAEVEVAVSAKRMQMVTFTKTLTAKQAVVERAVGGCSTLTSPSSHGGRGSLGYYSQTKCRDEARSSVVTVMGLHVPKAYQQKYGDLKISFVGGAAKGSRSAYIVMYHYDAVSKDYVKRVQYAGAWGRHEHPGATSGEKAVVGPNRAKPAIFWYLGLTDGSRYDIQSFTVSLEYRTLAELGRHDVALTQPIRPRLRLEGRRE